MLDILNNAAGFLLTLFATSLGVFFGSLLDSLRERRNRTIIFNNLKKALALEFRNNKRLIEKSTEGKNDTRSGISFETFKLVVSNEIFLDELRKDKALGENLLDDIWKVVSELREVKGFSAYTNYRKGIEYTDPGFQKFKEVCDILESS